MQKRAKILYVITKSNWGGAQRYVFDLATTLPRDRFDIAVAAGGSGELTQKLNEAGIRTITIPHLQRDISTLKEIVSFYSLFKIFKKERPDIAHLNSSKIGGLGAIAARMAGVPKIIFTVHGWAFHENRPAWQRSTIRTLSKIASSFQDHIIHVSTKDLAATELYVAPSKKSVHIPLGIKETHYLPRDEARQFLSRATTKNIFPDAVVVGTIAELTKNKGLNYLVDAINQIKFKVSRHKLQVVIIGAGEEKENLQNQINSLGIEKTVYLAGFIPDAARYIKAFNCFVLPSLKEGLPYTLLEARAAGIPVIATDVGGTPEALEGHDAILVTPLNSRKIANALAVIMSRSNRDTSKNSPQKKATPSQTAFNEMLKRTITIYRS